MGAGSGAEGKGEGSGCLRGEGGLYVGLRPHV